MNRTFRAKLDKILRGECSPAPTLAEGSLVSISKLISDTIRVPEGDYIIAVVSSDKCVLVPTNEASQEKFEVFKPTLAGFFNPEVHQKTVDKAEGNTILDATDKP